MFSKRQLSVIWFTIVLALFVAGCKKKPPAPAPPPPPPPTVEQPKPKPAAPVVSQFTAEPSSIERGQSSTLRWSATGADTVSIDNGIGTVQASGSRRVFPSDSTTYTLSATGLGGTTTASATVNVSAPPPPAPPTPAPAAKASLIDMLSSQVQDAYFDYDKSDIREDARAALTRDADALKSILNVFPNATISMEGHCDDRGSAEYNLGLGDRRATMAKDFLVQLGIPADRLRPVSYGKERPQCTESDESCWQRNRRVHFTSGQ